MHQRVLAFYISSNENSSSAYKKALNHLQELAKSFSKEIAVVQLKHYRLHLVYEGDLEEVLLKEDECIKFCVGPHKARRNSGWSFNMENRSKIYGAFLLVRINNKKITIINDFGGILPVYYSLRNGLCMSNIEPVIVLGSDSSYSDLSSEAVYELLRYSILHGTETLYRHIRNQEPDSTYVYSGNNEPAVEYNNTIPPAEISKQKDTDIIAELTELNRKIVHETLADEDDIILSLSSGYDSRIILAAAAEDKDIRSKLRCFTHTPNMSLETRPAKKLCEISGLSWEKAQLPVDSFNMQKLEQILKIFGSTFNVHGKYKLDFIDQIKHTFIPGKSVMVEGYMTGAALSLSALHGFDLCNRETLLADQMGKQVIYRYIPDEYLTIHSRCLNSEMKYHIEPVLRKILNRYNGNDKARVTMFGIWTRQRNFGSYQSRTMTWEIPHISPHLAPEFIDFSLRMPSQLLNKKKNMEMVFSKYYPHLASVGSNSNLTVKNILKSSIISPNDGIQHYLPMLIKYYFKQPWLLPEKLLAEMKDPVVPDLRSIGEKGVYPLFDLNAESREIFDGYFALEEVNNLFTKAMTGDRLSTKRLMILEPLAYALKMLEK